jgi:hypothetical protein
MIDVNGHEDMAELRRRFLRLEEVVLALWLGTETRGVSEIANEYFRDYPDATQ